MGRFQKATRKQLKLRMAICGPTGAGKTRTALKLAKYLGQRVAVIDTENRSASIYVGLSDVPDFDVLELDSFEPRAYYEAIRDAEREGYDVIIVDSATHAWSGKDGVLAMVDKAAKRSQAGNSFSAWRDVTPEHNELVEALVRCKAHLIVTLRSKMEYVLETNDRGKQVPRKVGMAPIQRDGMEYEFSVVAEMDVDHNLMVTKTRLDPLDGYVKNKPGQELAEKMLECLNSGVVDERPFAQAGTPSSSQAADRSPQTREASSRTSSESRSSTTENGERTDQPKDIAYWRNGHNGVYGRAVAARVAKHVEQDEYGLSVPSLPVPVFSAESKVYPSRAYNDPEVKPGLLREVIFMKADFQRQPSNVRLWVGYLVARHEIGKLARDLEAAAAEAALASQPPESAEQPPASEGGCGADAADLGGAP